MKKFLVSCFFGWILFLHWIILFANGENATLYYGQGCPHCAQVEEYLDKNKSSLPLKIIGKEVYDLIHKHYTDGLTEGVFEYDFTEHNDNVLRATRYPILVKK